MFENCFRDRYHAMENVQTAGMNPQTISRTTKAVSLLRYMRRKTA